MKTYAYLQNGVVWEIISPMTDEEGQEIALADRFTADFCAACVDVAALSPMPAHGWSATESAGSWSFAAPVAPTPTSTEQAGAALDAGLSIASTGTPALNGTYAIDQLSQMDIIAIETSLNAGKGFPGGAVAFNYADTSGVMHAFTAANFADFAAAVRDYVYALKSVIAGASMTLPAPTSTIT
jgi:hypothetical protein